MYVLCAGINTNHIYLHHAVIKYFYIINVYSGKSKIQIILLVTLLESLIMLPVSMTT